ncbi:MAG: HD-GYP domain-containing protein [Betaproteobacteria bacterium]|nr:HD-GYP domain-containing protein [Betaproteobacteria bacterium]
MQQLKLAELIGALSHALDLTEGQPRGHCVRCAYIGMALADQLGLDADERWDLYYTLLLKDLGCSSNAARICELYLTDDLRFKRDFKLVGSSLPQVARFVLVHTGLRSGLAERFRATLEIFQNGSDISRELIQTRCQRGADIARQMRFGDNVASAIHALDEHWDGSGKPDGLAGEAIALHARIALLAQVVDVFHTASGPKAALAEARLRSGSWFDPQLVRALEQVADDAFWEGLRDPQLAQRVYALEPALHSVPLDDDYLDEIAEAFGQIIDAKSPFTAGHSARVGLYTDLIAEQLGIDPERRRWLRRGALLHDMGKLGVSNTVLDKPGKLDETEWQAMRMHALYTEQILQGIEPFAELAFVAGAHHERLDGGGYPRGLHAADIPLETRVITTADIFDAISADRPYRAAVPVAQTLDMMQRLVGSALDERCMRALRVAVERVEAGLSGAAVAAAAG